MILYAKTLCVFLAASSLLAPSARSQSDSTRTQVLAVEQEWNAAELHHDAKALAELMDEDVTISETDGIITTKAEEVGFSAEPSTHFEILESHGLVVHDHGAVAVVTGAYHEKGTYRGKPFEHRGRFTDTWLRRDGRWKCIASHFSIPVKD